MSTAGRASNMPKAGAGGSSVGSAGATMETAGTGSPGGSVTTLSFDVTTAATGGFLSYAPKNIGAIWVQDSSGKLVKSLEVWARLREVYLTRYNGVRKNATIDVTASATLNSHKAHHVTWDMKGVGGAAVPPGKYTLVVECTDSDTTGQSLTTDFDISAGATTLMPMSNQYFTALKLTLQ
jgi:hypothetical protein